MADGRNVIARGEIARQLLEDQVMKDAFLGAEERFVKEWRATEPKEIARRETVWAQVQGLDEVRRQLRTILHEGQHAALSESKRG